MLGSRGRIITGSGQKLSCGGHVATIVFSIFFLSAVPDVILKRMKRPIRDQILFPFLAVVVLSVAALSASTAYQAAGRSEERTTAQLRAVVETLTQTSVPYTDSVLQKMRGLSGAHFVACAGADMRVIASTLPERGRLPDQMTHETADDLAGLSSLPTVTFYDVDYFVTRLRARGNPTVDSLLILYPRDTWSRDRWAAALPPLLVGVAAVMLTTAVSTWLAQRFSGRLRELQRRVSGIAGGDFRQIPVGDRGDEVHDLAQSVNRMCRQLHEMQQTIRQTERTRVLAQLAGGLAHQLRNAVTGARLALQLHERRCRHSGDDESLLVARRQLALIETQVKGLLSLGRPECRPRTSCNLPQLADEVCDLLLPTCEHARVRWQTERPHSPITILAETESLQAAILNLALNAIEAAGAHGTVILRVTGTLREACLDFVDSGSGPPPELAETLFDPFVTGKPEGIGLGLAMARQVAHDHGGSLSWRREGDRTCFRLTLPAIENGCETCECATTTGPTEVYCEAPPSPVESAP